MESTNEFTRLHVGMASLLAKTIAATGEIERWLDIEVEGREARSLADAWLGKTQEELASARFSPDTEPERDHRKVCTLLLRKARIHACAVLKANENNNVHSLAVQARPLLECAGQAVFIFHHLFIAPGFQMEPERALDKVNSYVDADFYQTLIKTTKGAVGHEELLQMIEDAASKVAKKFGEPIPKRRKGKRLRQSDKVAMLRGGKAWYDYLSEYFCHGEANWTGPSFEGGVSSMGLDHELMCVLIMHYLVDQMAVMNAYASLYPVAGKVVDGQMEIALAQLEKVREESSTLMKCFTSDDQAQ